MTINPIRERKAPMTPRSTQIVFVDLQPEIVRNSRTNPPQDLIRAAAAVARIGGLLGLPMLVSLLPASGREPSLVPDLEALLADAPRLVRTAFAPFDDAPTAARVEDNDRHDLIVCGAMMEAAVLLACFGGIREGHEVHVPVDACGGLDRRTEEAALRRIESFDANTASVATLGAVLGGDVASANGGAVMGFLAPLMER